MIPATVNCKRILAISVLIMTVFLSACRRDNNNTTITPITLSCNDVDVDQTWADRGDGVDYIIDCVIGVNAKLTIAPGVVIMCKTGAGVLVNTGGALKAIGTTDKHIVLKGDVDAPGVWKGIYINSSSIENELNYCEVHNAGNSSFDGNLNRKAAIRVALTAKLKLQNSIVAKSGYDGLYVDGLDSDSQNPITLFAANQFSGNQNYPISAIAPVANALDGEISTYINNSINKIHLRGGNLYGTHVWKKNSVAYLAQDLTSVGYYSDNGSLTIQPGVTVEFMADAGLGIGAYATASWLRIEGTAANRITLTGTTATPGAWKGISFVSSSSNNVVSYTDISYGGSSSYSGSANEKGNLLAGSAGQSGAFTVNNCTINYSGSYGIFVNSNSADITVPGNVTYTGNTNADYYKEP